MKHLSRAPRAAVALRADVPARPRPGRAARARQGPGAPLPAAEEMDADLDRVARGGRSAADDGRTRRRWCSRGAALGRADGDRPAAPAPDRRRAPACATAVLRRAAARARLAVAARAAAARPARSSAAGSLYGKIQDQLSEQADAGARRVGIKRASSRCRSSKGAGLTPNVQPRARARRRAATSSTRTRAAGSASDKGNTVRSTSRAASRRRVPDVVGKSRRRVAALASANLKRRSLQVFRRSTPGTVIAQDPERRQRGRPRARSCTSTCRRGPKPVQRAGRRRPAVRQRAGSSAAQGFAVAAHRRRSRPSRRTPWSPRTRPAARAAGSATVTLIGLQGPEARRPSPT